jgi:hypothetical protein
MDLGSSLQDLQQTEADCLRKFRARARRLMAADPKLKKDIAFAKAVHELPKTANLYQRTRHLLAMAGVRALPLFD